ncbi:MAG: hypothetical protein JW913_08965 [Chitinispirillaceae bacterium]|nr:hypothetical protein [Chitinispirillaceae bacterium]
MKIQPCFFNAHHAPIGAFASFTLGFKGASGGLGFEMGHPANQNVYIGLESGQKGVYNALPFYDSPEKHEGLITSDPAAASVPEVRIEPFPDDAVSREYGLCSDTWQAGELRFTVYSPVEPVPDPGKNPDHGDLPRILLPAVIAEMEIDNRHSERCRKAFFGFTGNEGPGMRRIGGTTGDLRGIGQGRNLAICTDEKKTGSGIGYSAEEVLYRSSSAGTVHGGLGTAALLLFDAPAGEITTLRFVICFFHEGSVTTGVEASYFYRRFFESIEDAAQYALHHFPAIRQAAVAAESRIETAPLSAQRRFMLIHAVRSYYGSTQLLDTSEGPLWIVNEGEYRMINTLDLTVDHLFFELAMNPWVVRNVLDWYARRCSYCDTVRLPGDGREYPGGVGFTHDMGVANVIAPAGASAYEQPGRNGLLSYMTHEQLVNWVLAAAVYALNTRDGEWLQSKEDLLCDCFASLINRDHPESGQRTGVMRRDSSRCAGGSEITTYDSLDPSLGRGRGNSCGAMKRWAAFLLLHRLFEMLGRAEAATEYIQEARRIAGMILSHVNGSGFVPALVDTVPATTALPLVEGLIFPWQAGCGEVFDAKSEFAPLIDAARRHFTYALSSGACRCADGGWKLSSGSDITWLSKLYLCRFIATEILGIDEDGMFTEADDAHCRWLLDERNSYFAWSDQFRSGAVVGSRYYPRGVTSILWLREKRRDDVREALSN